MPKEATLPQRRQHAKYERLIEAAKTKPPLPTAVAHPCDATSLAGALEAYRAGLIVPILVGPADKIRKLAKAGGIDLAGVEIVDAPHGQAAAVFRHLDIARRQREDAAGIVRRRLPARPQPQVS